MNEPWTLASALVAGILLGGFFFGGLWWTVREGLSSKRTALWFPASLLLRMSVTLSGLYVVSGSHWDRLMLCLLGLILARGVVRWLTRPSGEIHSPKVLEDSLAP